MEKIRLYTLFSETCKVIKAVYNIKVSVIKVRIAFGNRLKKQMDVF